MRIGVATLARPTFDVPYAQAMADAAFRALDASGVELVGSRELLFDAAAARGALDALSREGLDGLLLLQATFTDATMTVALAQAISAPLAIWALPEPRSGGRLRLNAFCGLNLAAHALGRAGKAFSTLYAAPDAPGIAEDLRGLFGGLRQAGGRRQRAPKAVDAPASEAAARAVETLAGSAIGLVGQHPDGFDTCRYEPEALQALAGVRVAPLTLDEVFSRAKAAPEARVAAHHGSVAVLEGIAGVDQPQLDRSLRVFDALKSLAQERGLEGMAVRCWPEMFTEYGCAACGPMALMTGEGTPCACEADVYGTVSALALQAIAGEPAWLVDIVDLDAASGTGVFWHCGSAPLSMADPEAVPQAQIHSNRRMPLLLQFPLKPGRITIARLSQARNEVKLVIGGAEVVRAPMSFTGTSAVVRFDAPIERVMEAMMGEALEHHVALVYGDHRAALEALAAAWRLPVISLDETE